MPASLSRRPLGAFTVTVVLALAVLAAGCGSSSKTATPDATVTTLGATTSTTVGGSGTTASTLSRFSTGTIVIDVGTTDLGTVLVDGTTGYTLYAFTADTNGTSTCVEATCTDAWPPLTGASIAVASSAGEATGRFKLVARPDGAQQLTVAGHPVYRFSGDNQPGDTQGQGVGGTWYALNPDGTLIR